MPLSPRRVLKTFRYAMYFDGVRNYVYIADNPMLRQRLFTVFVYAYMTQWVSVQTGLFYKSGNRPRYYMFMEVDAPSYGYRVRHVLVDASTGVRYDYSTAQPNLQWFSTALVYDGSKAYSYLNGVLMNSASLSIDMTKNNNDIYIGKPLGNPNPVLISIVLYYSTPLSASDIMWNHLYPDNPVRNGLVLWLKADPAYVKDIDGDGIPEWIDLSGYGNHGKIYGAQLVQLVKTPARVLKPVRVSPAAR
jgi:hypothetical protein